MSVTAGLMVSAYAGGGAGGKPECNDATLTIQSNAPSAPEDETVWMQVRLADSDDFRST